MLGSSMPSSLGMAPERLLVCSSLRGEGGARGHVCGVWGEERVRGWGWVGGELDGGSVQHCGFALLVGASAKVKVENPLRKICALFGL